MFTLNFQGFLSHGYYLVVIRLENKKVKPIYLSNKQRRIIYDEESTTLKKTVFFVTFLCNSAFFNYLWRKKYEVK